MREFILHLYCPNLRFQADITEIEGTLANSPGVGAVDVQYLKHNIDVITVNQDGGVDVLQRLDRAGYACVSV